MTVIDFGNAFYNVLEYQKKKKNSFTAFSNTNIFFTP